MPKDLGGLRLFSMKHRNEAILAKLCWRLTHEEGKPWANMLLAKFLCPNRLTEEGSKLPCSRIWAACKKGGPIYVKGLRWTVRNGDFVNLWLDFWLPIGRLRELIIGPLNRGEEELSVRQCFDENHVWKPSSISFELPTSVLSTIKAIPFSYTPQTNDSLIWAYSKNGSFSIQAAYLIAKGLNPLNLVACYCLHFFPFFFLRSITVAICHVSSSKVLVYSLINQLFAGNKSKRRQSWMLNVKKLAVS